MNKKNILQNLLRRALTPAGTNMTRWAMALAVVMISLLAPTTEAWADGEEPQQSKPTYQLTSGDGIVHFFLKEGYKMTEVTEAPEGATIVVSPDFDMIPAGKYATGEYTSDQVMVTPALDEDTGLPKNTSDGQFTMPAMAVTVSAVLAPQEEYTIYLNKTMPQTIPESMWILLNSLENNNIYDDQTNERFLDLNLDGKRDVLLTEDYNEATGVSTYSVVRQAGADDIEEDLRFPLTYVHNLQYNSVLFKLSKEAVQSGWITVADGTATGTALVYNGQAQTPAVIVKDGETDVTSDFDVTYSNNKNAGEATADNAPTVTVTAKATSTSYKGSATKTFTINKKPITVTAENKSMAIGGTEPVLTYTIEGLVEGDNVTIELQRTEGNDAGTYDITLKSISGDDNYSVTFVKGTFTIKKEANISVKNPENLAKDETCEVTLLDTEYAPSEKELAYHFTPVAGVTVDGVIKVALESTSSNKAIYKVTENRAEKLTFGDVEWKESGALLTRPKNLTFSGAAVDATNIKFTNALTLSTGDKMTLVKDFGDAVGTITGSNFTVASGLTGEGHLYFESGNIDYIVTKGTEEEEEEQQQGQEQGDDISDILHALERDPRPDGEYDELDGSKTTIQNKDGTQHITNTKTNDDGSIVTDTYFYADGSIAVKETVTNTDGSMTVKEIVKDADGTTHKVEETTNPDGTKTSKETTKNPVQLVGTVTVTGSNGESTEFGVIKGGKEISISEITNQPIAIENGKEGAMTIEKTTKKSFLANSTLNMFESTVTLRFRSSAFKAGMKITVLHLPDGSSTWEKITPDNVGDGECIVTFNSLARRHSATRGAKAARPFFRIDYSGANITCKAGDVELQAAEEAHGINRGDEQDIIIESGKTYDILTDKNLILTLQPSESDFLLTSFTMIVPKDSDPNDINGDGDVNAVDLVKAIAAGKTQAEIDAIVNVIMGK